jgi:hypothetical protein
MERPSLCISSDGEYPQDPVIAIRVAGLVLLHLDRQHRAAWVYKLVGMMQLDVAHMRPGAEPDKHRTDWD